MKRLIITVMGCLLWSQVYAETYTATPSTVDGLASRLRPGDTLLLQSGTYRSLSRVASGASPSNPIQIKAAPGATARVGSIALQNTRNVSFEGLDIDCRVSGAREGVWLGHGTSHIRVASSAIHGCGAHGILVPHYSAGNHQFLGLDIYNNGTRPHFDHGIYLSAPNNQIANSKIHDNAAYGVHVYSRGKPTANRNVVWGNQIYDNGQLGDTSYGIVLQDGTGNAAVGNTLRNNGTGDIQVGNRTSGTVLSGNQTSGKVDTLGPVSSEMPGTGGMPEVPQPSVPRQPSRPTTGLPSVAAPG